MGLKFEAWTLPTAATFERKFTIPDVLAGASGVRELSGWTDGSFPIPASWPKFDDLIATDDASLIRVFDEGQIIDEVIAQRCPFSTSRPSVRIVSGPGINGIVEKCGIYALADGVDDWIWGSEVNLLSNPFFSATSNTPEVWELQITASGGTYTLTDGVDTTSAINFDAGSATIATRLQTDIAAIVDVVVVGTSVSPYNRTITFLDPVLGVSLAINTGSLTGGSGTVTVIEAGSFGYGPWEEAHAFGSLSFGTYDTFTVSSAQAFSGGRSLLIDPGTIGTVSNRNPGVQQVVRVTPGQTYRGSIRIYPTSATDRFRVGVFTVGEEPVAFSDPNGATLTASTWNLLTLSPFVVPDGITELIFRTAVTNPGVYEPSQAWYDDAVLSEGMAAASAQSILDQLLTAAQARGTFGFLEIDAQADEDTNGVALDDISFAAWYGQDLGHVVDGLHALGYNWRIRPAEDAIAITPAGTTTHVIQIFDIGTYPTDHTTSPGGPSILAGVAGPAEVVKRVPDFTAVRARGLGDLAVDDTNAAALANMGRWEKIVDAENITSEVGLQLLIDAAFADEDLNQTAASAVLTYSDTARPFIRFGEGDRVWWQVPGILTKEARPVKRIAWSYGTPTTYQVQGSKVLSGDAGIAQAVDYLLRQFQRRRTASDGAGLAAITTIGEVTGAFIHLVRGEVQEIDVGGEDVEWTGVFHEPFVFTYPTLPSVGAAVIPKWGYYDIKPEMRWSSWEDGGSVQIIRESGGAADVVWPPSADPGIFTSTSGDRFSDVVKGIMCAPGDIIRMFVDPVSVSAEDLASATMTVELVDHVGFQVGAALNGYRVDFSTQENLLRVIRRSNGAFDVVASISKAHSHLTWYWVRARIDGQRIRAKSWSGTEGSEPGGWDIDFADTAQLIPASGMGGLAQWSTGGADVLRRCDVIEVTNDGATPVRTDFSGYAAGALAGQGWTTLSQDTLVHSVVTGTGSTGDAWVNVTPTLNTAGHHFIGWSDVGAGGSQEVLARMMAENGTVGLMLRGNAG